ncbi:MAG: fumarate hydratase [Candidatus Omnitrophica bacterium]|nr:fumarate hydratase [Candidatus Omnitrophota bacterium]MBU1925716.1 fumarate hydratase [Candidatus Omnitrophota bacterium]
MRIIGHKILKRAVYALVTRANTELRSDVLRALKQAQSREKSALAKSALKAILENAAVAKKEKLAICQDTGLPVVFLELGQKVFVKGDIIDIIGRAIEEGYKKSYFRASIQKDALSRSHRPSYGPVIVHTDIVRGNKIKITLLPKGFGCENKAQVKMFAPTAAVAEIEDFVVAAVKQAGASACPPYVVGVGIGGTQDLACLLAKRALLLPIDKRNKSKNIAILEQRLNKRINTLGIGPFGYGGKTTSLAVKIKTYPTHIAGLPVAVNISCHALRSAAIFI